MITALVSGSTTSFLSGAQRWRGGSLADPAHEVHGHDITPRSVVQPPKGSRIRDRVPTCASPISYVRFPQLEQGSVYHGPGLLAYLVQGRHEAAGERNSYASESYGQQRAIGVSYSCDLGVCTLWRRNSRERGYKRMDALV